MKRRSFWLGTLGTLLAIGAAFATVSSAVKTTTTPHPPPSAPEESATIPDDPTVAPDSAESADHSVSFPSDI